jgi:hypothetical protein
VRSSLLIALVLAGAADAAAEHRPYFRYVVLGYVGDAAGHPVGRQRITLTRDKTGLEYSDETNDQGFYLIVARLDDRNLGERLTLRIGDVAIAVVARFDPQNHRDERGTRVDLVAGKPIERAAWFPSTLRQILGAK